VSVDVSQQHTMLKAMGNFHLKMEVESVSEIFISEGHGAAYSSILDYTRLYP
jgi:hypothetical protein